MTLAAEATAGRRDPLALDAITVWLVDLRLPAGALTPLSRTLSADERARAAKLRSLPALRRFVGTRAVLRHLLAAELGGTASGVQLRRGEHGKPALQSPAEPDLRFNVSHSRNLAVVAIAGDRELGADVEYVPTGRATERLERVFAPSERAALERMPGRLRTEAFFQLWTAKEAYVKARGDGIGYGLSRFEIPVPVPAPPAAVRIADDGGRWTLRTFWPRPGYVGAVVAEGDDWELRTRHWTWETLDLRLDDDDVAEPGVWTNGGGI